MQTVFIRTCQECGHKQKAKDPKGVLSEAYANAKCRRCYSPALDYGKNVVINAEGKIVAAPAE
jgi:hypothetical protein